ncbi:hypothetical protein [Emticicia sp. W12TSBA100-4]|uniref:hypothetical protein n=1 Tax=Emticicia sp. W12TSBA100-4 TaxID=3160965 RepID=UPI003305DBB2
MSIIPLPNSIKAHAEYLKEVDVKKYNEMIADLAIHGQTEYFRQTLCRNGNEGYDLRNVRSVVSTILCKYLGFTPENFINNELPKLKQMEL